MDNLLSLVFVMYILLFLLSIFLLAVASISILSETALAPALSNSTLISYSSSNTFLSW